nr:hypothetical protein [Tanacetum cinerariifolium]
MGGTTAQTRFESVSKHSNDSLLIRGNTFQSEDSLKLDELMALCTTLQNRVLDLEKTTTTQRNEIASLKRRVKKLEKKNRLKTHRLKRLYKFGLMARVESFGNEESSGDDSSRQGRIDAIDANEEITLVSVQDEVVSNDVDKEMFNVDVLDGEEVFVAEHEVAVKGVNNEVNIVEVVEVINITKLIFDATQVSAASATTTVSAATTTIAIITTVGDITLAQALKEIKSTKPNEKGIDIQELGRSTTIKSSQQSQDKGKGILIEPVKPMKRKDQIRFDEEAALKLQGAFDEEERLAREKDEKVKEANIALIETWDDIQAKIDADHQLAKRMQAQEQEELSIVEKATLFQQLLKKKRKHFAAKRAEEKKNHQQKLNRERQCIRFRIIFNTFVRSTKICEEQKQSMEDTMLELVKICQEKKFLCIHDNVDDLIESALNTKLLSINSQRLEKEQQEVKNVVEQPAERGNHIAPIISTKEPEHSLSIGYEHLSITPETESNEECDVPISENSPICDDHSDIFSDSKINDDILVYDDDFKDIEYVEASLPDPDIVSEEENVVHQAENDVNQEEEEVDLEDISQIQDVVLREKLLSIIHLIFNIESLNDNPIPDCMLNSFESDNSLSDNFSPEFETFCDHTEETRSEEADLFLVSDNSIPPGIENVTDDLERDIRFLEESLIDDSIHESYDSNFEDNPSIPRPPPEPPDATTDAGKEIPVVMNDKDKFDEDYYFFMFDKVFSFLFVESEDTIFDPGNPTTATQQVFETYQNVKQEIRGQLNAEAEAVQIILTGIDNDIYSTVDACPNACEM